MAALQTQAGTAAASKPSATPVPQGEQPDKPQITRIQPSQSPTSPEPVQTSPTIQPTPDTAAPARPAKPGQQALATGQTGIQTPTQVPPEPTGEPPKTTSQATQKPRRAPPPPPAPTPLSLLDQAFARPYLLAVPVIVILLIGWGASRLRGRFRESKQGADEGAPAFAESDATANSPGTFSPAGTDSGLAARGGGDGDEVDPLEEAEIFLAYGRDEQAEELLQEAIAAHPARFEIHLKLLEIYVKQGNKDAFEKLARDIQQKSSSEGEIWDRVVKLGYAIDPDNPRYADGAGDEAERSDYAQTTGDMSASREHLDFDVGMDDHSESGTSTPAGTHIDLGANMAVEKSQVMDTQTIDVTNDSVGVDSDMNLDPPSLDPPSLDHGASALDLSADDSSNAIDFDSDTSGDEPAVTEQQEELGASSTDSGLDFDVNEMSFDAGGGEQSESSDVPALDLSGLSLDLDGTSTNEMESSGKDDKWFEVQTKFDLAKAYQEMGDNDGAREILKEVISEGDSEQKAAAESVLSSLE